MDIIFRGRQNTEEASASLISILNLFKERYGIENFCDIKLGLSLIDSQGDTVDLVDPVTTEVFATLEVYKSQQLYDMQRQKKHLKLIVDNTNKGLDR